MECLQRKLNRFSLIGLAIDCTKKGVCKMKICTLPWGRQMLGDT